MSEPRLSPNIVQGHSRRPDAVAACRSFPPAPWSDRPPLAGVPDRDVFGLCPGCGAGLFKAWPEPEIFMLACGCCPYRWRLADKAPHPPARERISTPREAVISVSVLDSVQVLIGLNRLRLFMQGKLRGPITDADLAATERAIEILQDVSDQAQRSSSAGGR